MVTRRNVLIFHAAALGDFVVTWPLAMALSRLYPQSRIVYVTHSSKAALAERLLGVESSDIESGWHALFSETPELAEKPAKLLQSAHSIFSFVSSGEDLWSRNVAKLAPEAKLATLAARPAQTYSHHVSDFLLEQLASHPAERDAVSQMIKSVNDRGVGARLSPEPLIVLHPGSGSREKCWPIEHWLELMRQLATSGRRVHVLLGEVERERFSKAERDALTSAGTVYEPASYLELLSHLTHAAVFVGNDSGPGHLAATLGVPTVSLFGPSNPTVWKPLGPSVQIVHDASLLQISPDRVFAAVLGMLTRRKSKS